MAHALLASLTLALASAPGDGPVRLGVDVLLEARVELVRGKRVGLITHPAGVDGDLVPSVDRLFADPRFELVQLFAPEHGIRGDVAAGDRVADEVDARTGLPVESLYGARRRPSPEALARIDVLLVDLQDVGARCYTFISTLGEAMRACAEAKKPLVVLDRPNPLGGLAFEGPLREEAHASFVGWGPLPVTHGMTIGEVARFYRSELEIPCALEVVPMRGWNRDMVWEDTGLVWTQTSPHIPGALAAHLYVATAMAASTTKNASDGVGSTTPFELFGAEFVDARALRDALAAARLPGVRFQETAWQPFYGKFQGRSLRGVRLILDEPRRFEPVRTARTLLATLAQLWPDRLELEEAAVCARFWGTSEVREAIERGASAAELGARARAGLDAFGAARERALLYGLSAPAQRD